VPAYQILNPSEILTDPPGDKILVSEHTITKPEARPSGPRFGTLVHAVVRDSRLDPELIDSLAHSHGRVLGANEEEIKAAVSTGIAALESRLLQGARTADRLHSELPVTRCLDGNRYIEGVIDLAFKKDGLWHVVDFKTDTYVPSRGAQYQRQLRWYAFALSQLTHEVVNCHLLAI